MPDWLVPFRHTFFALLISQGLKAVTIKGYVPAVDRLCAEAGRRGLTTPDDVDEATFVDIQTQVLRRLSDYSRQRWTRVLNRFIAHLVHERVIAAADEPAPAALDALCADYGAWLRSQCGSAPGTIKTYQGKLWSFLTFRFGGAAPGDLHAITRADIDAWFSPTDRKGPVGARSRACALRSLFRFLFATGRIDRDLALSVPRIAERRSPGPIRHLSAAVHLLRAGVDINTIRAWLGHVSLETTNRYAEVDLEMKAKALQMCADNGTDLTQDRSPTWHADGGLMTFLASL